MVNIQDTKYSALARLWAQKVDEGTKDITEVPEKYLAEIILVLEDSRRYDTISRNNR